MNPLSGATSLSVAQQYECDLREFKLKYGLKIVPKSQSRFMKLLYVVSLMWIWNRKFMTGYTTTIGSTIYSTRLTSASQRISDLALLRHEAQHIQDSRRFGSVAWALLYLFPQSLALLAFGAFFHSGFLVALLALAPWPAPFRVWAELRGYARTWHTWKEFGCGYRRGIWDARMRETFCGWSYFRMSWDWTKTRNEMRRVLDSHK